MSGKIDNVLLISESFSLVLYRKLYLSDVARLTNPEMLINRIVYDLDLLVTASQPPSSECLQEEEGFRKDNRHILSESVAEESGKGPLVNEVVSQMNPEPDETSGEKSEKSPIEPEGLSSNRLELGDPKLPPTDVEPALLQTYIKLEEPLLPSSCIESGDTETQTEEFPHQGRLESAARQLEAGERELMDAQMPLTNNDSEVNVHQILEELEWDTFSPIAAVEEADVVQHLATESNSLLSSVPHLEFESRFESGNLRKAIQVYNL